MLSGQVQMGREDALFPSRILGVYRWVIFLADIMIQIEVRSNVFCSMKTKVLYAIETYSAISCDQLVALQQIAWSFDRTLSDTAFFLPLGCVGRWRSQSEMTLSTGRSLNTSWNMIWWVTQWSSSMRTNENSNMRCFISYLAWIGTQRQTQYWFVTMLASTEAPELRSSVKMQVSVWFISPPIAQSSIWLSSVLRQWSLASVKIKYSLMLLTPLGRFAPVSLSQLMPIYCSTSINIVSLCL